MGQQVEQSSVQSRTNLKAIHYKSHKHLGWNWAYRRAYPHLWRRCHGSILWNIGCKRYRLGRKRGIGLEPWRGRSNLNQKNGQDNWTIRGISTVTHARMHSRTCARACPGHDSITNKGPDNTNTYVHTSEVIPGSGGTIFASSSACQSWGNQLSPFLFKASSFDYCNALWAILRLCLQICKANHHDFFPDEIPRAVSEPLFFLTASFNRTWTGCLQYFYLCWYILFILLTPFVTATLTCVFLSMQSMPQRETNGVDEICSWSAFFTVISAVETWTRQQ